LVVHELEDPFLSPKQNPTPDNNNNNNKKISNTLLGTTFSPYKLQARIGGTGWWGTHTPVPNLFIYVKQKSD
jgi:hypothetical protein